MKNKNFVMTKDKDVRKQLMDLGLLEIHNNDGIYIFVNEPKKLSKINFSELQLTFTNKLYF